MDRYLWAVGPSAAQIPPAELVQGKYQVVAPQIWLETRPELPPHFPQELPDKLIPYLRLYPHRLHIPTVYGFAQMGKEPSPERDILLLENVPIDSSGSLYPSIVEAWPQASTVRQIYWLWQMLQLWQSLRELGMAQGLLIAENLRVEGWRVRLLELYADACEDVDREFAMASILHRVSDSQKDMHFEGAEAASAAALVTPRKKQNLTSLKQLGLAWANWFPEAKSQVASQLQEIYHQMQADDSEVNAIAQKLNHILLQTAAPLHLRLRVASATDTGLHSQHNEDSFYPSPSDLPSDFSPPSDPLIPHLTIICDGIGGHEGGEVASQLAVQSIKLQVQALIAEVAQQDEIMTPELMGEHLAAIIRVANNLIAARNDEQGRESRRRMGTTLVMALQLPQQVKTAGNIDNNSHEIYIVHVGDSRAYWMTSQYCQQLTVDDDVAVREVRTGRSLYREALQRSDAGALTQALGTRDSEFLRPTVQRFILEEDGLLLLCSDGLSDNNLVERSWRDYAEPVLNGQMPLESAVQYLINLANQKNGHDNTSVVLTYCRVSPEYPVLLNLGETSSNSLVPQVRLTPQFSEMSAAQSDAYKEPITTTQSQPMVVTSDRPRVKGWVLVLCLLLLLVTAGAAGLLTKWLIEPSGKPSAQPETSYPSPTQ